MRSVFNVVTQVYKCISLYSDELLLNFRPDLTGKERCVAVRAAVNVVGGIRNGGQRSRAVFILENILRELLSGIQDFSRPDAVPDSKKLTLGRKVRHVLTTRDVCFCLLGQNE